MLRMFSMTLKKEKKWEMTNETLIGHTERIRGEFDVFASRSTHACIVRQSYVNRGLNNKPTSAPAAHNNLIVT